MTIVAPGAIIDAPYVFNEGSDAKNAGHWAHTLRSGGWRTFNGGGLRWKLIYLAELTATETADQQISTIVAPVEPGGINQNDVQIELIFRLDGTQTAIASSVWGVWVNVWNLLGYPTFVDRDIIAPAAADATLSTDATETGLTHVVTDMFRVCTAQPTLGTRFTSGFTGPEGLTRTLSSLSLAALCTRTTGTTDTLRAECDVMRWYPGISALNTSTPIYKSSIATGNKIYETGSVYDSEGCTPYVYFRFVSSGTDKWQVEGKATMTFRANG